MTIPKTRPITPKEAVTKKTFPLEVFEAFNELISRKYDGNKAVIRQDDVVALIIEKGLKRENIFNNKWLDVEDAYRVAGWKVVYDKPGIGDNYEPFFTFTKKK